MVFLNGVVLFLELHLQQLLFSLVPEILLVVEITDSLYHFFFSALCLCRDNVSSWQEEPNDARWIRGCKGRMETVRAGDGGGTPPDHGASAPEDRYVDGEEKYVSPVLGYFCAQIVSSWLIHFHIAMSSSARVVAEVAGTSLKHGLT